MLTASIISLNIFVLILIIISIKQNAMKRTDKDDIEIELEMDLDKLSRTHYLLEAGKNEWRLNEKHYNNPNALVIYALGLIFNNPIIYFDADKLDMTTNRIRLPFLLNHYTNSELTDEERIEALVEIFFKQRQKIEKRLRKLYNLPSKEENQLSDNLIDTLKHILKH